MEQRFLSAVNVIRGLPKNGSYQPSNDMMLRFYSYYKQATLGPCTQRKPPFWDVVGRAKYDSHKSLGNMPKERAMELYVEELKKIIETMSYTDNVADFMGSISELNGIDVDDLEAVAPEAIKKVRSHPNSPFASREASPIRVPLRNGYVNGTSNEHSLVNGNSHLDDNFQSGHTTTEHSDDEYIDTVEDDTNWVSEPILQARLSRSSTRRSFELEQQNRGLPTTSAMTSYQPIEPAINQILRTVESMRNDLQQINHRMNIIERSMSALDQPAVLRYPRWWPFTNISPNWFIFLILWPFLAQRLAKILRKKSQ